MQASEQTSVPGVSKKMERGWEGVSLPRPYPCYIFRIRSEFRSLRVLLQIKNACYVRRQEPVVVLLPLVTVAAVEPVSSCRPVVAGSSCRT